MRERLDRSGVAWYPLRYHPGRSVPRKAWDAATLFAVALWLSVRHSVYVVHARSYIPALIAWILCRVTGVPFIFDLRGRLIEEYVEEGYWSESSRLVRWMRKWERRCLADAAAVVVLTDEARHQLYREQLVATNRPVDVIPCCVNVQKFSTPQHDATKSIVSGLGLGGRLVLVYVGSPILGELPDEMLRFFAAVKARRPDACLLILTAQREAFEACLTRAGTDVADVRLLTVAHDEMPAYLQAAHAAVNFVRPTPTKRASSSIKKAECLAAGLPLVLSAGAEDHDALLSAASVGVLVPAFTAEAYAEAVEVLLQLLEGGEALRLRCRATAESWYGLTSVGIPRYAAVYARFMPAAVGR